MTTTSSGWDESASAWIAAQGEDGDFGRRFVLDGPMRSRIMNRGFVTALDVGCGEGRFCRIMQAEGIRTVGIDPTGALIQRARELNVRGDYRIESAENFCLESASFDLVVSYLSLIDIPDIARATHNMVRVLNPGGTLLIANLTSFNTAGMPQGWATGSDGVARFCIDDYLEERPISAEWQGIRIKNFHRPLSSYMKLFLDTGLILRHFSEPPPTGGDSAKADRYRRVPFFHIMEWQKPA
ncbi:methyltransferase domain-containing protein [Paraburkholderia sp. 1N]|uniref:Methyltransferase domain-containing protein n=1 Tax=Paraburkholderia solitsugae TaxID=2675748 RepID=A0ABX2BI52_9BURK|nr:class I SAM-dependent methyltransferase [Paraburkholderia solitsugae]NPT40446.1 methyltransferase domain-containing protein [Paraburkholderia solitsugae]